MEKIKFLENKKRLFVYPSFLHYLSCVLGWVCVSLDDFFTNENSLSLSRT